MSIEIFIWENKPYVLQYNMMHGSKRTETDHHKYQANKCKKASLWERSYKLVYNHTTFGGISTTSVRYTG